MIRFLVILCLLAAAAFVSAMFYFDEPPALIWNRIVSALNDQPAPQATPDPRPSPGAKAPPATTPATLAAPEPASRSLFSATATPASAATPAGTLAVAASAPAVNFQSWIVTGERAVGFMKIEALKQVSDARMSTMFEFVSGRANGGKRKEFEKLGDWTYRYGDLKIHIPATSYRSVETAYGNGGLTGGDQMRGFFRLVEEPGKTDALKDYPPGANDWCLAEITPVWNEPAKEIKQLDLGPNLIFR